MLYSEKRVINALSAKKGSSRIFLKISSLNSYALSLSKEFTKLEFSTSVLNATISFSRNFLSPCEYNKANGFKKEKNILCPQDNDALNIL